MLGPAVVRLVVVPLSAEPVAVSWTVLFETLLDPRSSRKWMRREPGGVGAVAQPQNACEDDSPVVDRSS